MRIIQFKNPASGINWQTKLVCIVQCNETCGSAVHDIMAEIITGYYTLIWSSSFLSTSCHVICGHRRFTTVVVNEQELNVSIKNLLKSDNIYARRNTCYENNVDCLYCITTLALTRVSNNEHRSQQCCVRCLLSLNSIMNGLARTFARQRKQTNVA